MTKPLIVDILRHGRTQTENIFRGAIDDPLSDLGWQQMAQAVGDERWDEVVCSPLGRCRLFAQDLAENLQLVPRIDPRLREYHFGDWDGKTYDEVLSTQDGHVKQFFSDPESTSPPNGEPYVLFRQRVLQCWAEIVGVDAQSNAGKRVLVIAHGGVILVLLAHIFGVQHVHRKIAMPYASRSQVQVDLGSGESTLVFHR